MRLMCTACCIFSKEAVVSNITRIVKINKIYAIYAVLFYYLGCLKFTFYCVYQTDDHQFVYLSSSFLFCRFTLIPVKGLTHKQQKRSISQVLILRICRLEKISTFKLLNEPVREKTNKLGFRPGLTQTRLHSHTIKLEA